MSFPCIHDLHNVQTMCKHLPTTGDIFEMSPVVGKCLYIYMNKLLPKTGDIFGQSQFQSYQKMSVV